jgi:hypothetical protein
MSRLFKKALLVFLLGWVPLQASAFPLLALLCEHESSGMHGHAAVHAHHGPAGDHSAHDHHGDSGDDGSSPPSPHSCCHNLTSAAVPAVTPASAAPASGIEPTPLFHLSSFSPDQPKRPPLAA